MATITNTNLPPLRHFLHSFLSGLIVLIIFYWIVRGVIYWLKKRGDILENFESIGLSTCIAFIEQCLFFLAAIAGKEVFGWAAGGWLVFKGIHQWSRWGSPHSLDPDYKEIERAKKVRLLPKDYRDAIARNRFMVFSIGTGMSIAAGGISGAVYHHVMWWLQKCNAPLTNTPLILALISVVSITIGLFVFFKPDLTIETQKKFYEKINWRIEPISMQKEIHNTKIMGIFLVTVAIVAIIYSLTV